MLDLVKPCLQNQLVDRQVVKEMQIAHNKLSKRLQYMEACFNQQKGRNKVFDQINERITVAEMWQRQNQTDNTQLLDSLQAQINSLKEEMRHLNQGQEDLTKDFARLRFEQNEVYKLFTENDNKIVEDYINTKARTEESIALFKTNISTFDATVEQFKNMMEQHSLCVETNTRRIIYIQDETVAVKKACIELAQTTAR